MVVLNSKKFILRPYRKSDLISLVKNLDNKKVSRYMSKVPFPYKIKDGKKWIERCLQKNKKGKKKKVIFAIEINGEVAGSIGLDPIKIKHKAEIGYWLAEKYWGNGIMSEALRIMTNLGFEKLKLKRMQAHVFSENESSKKVLKKNGFQLEGRLKKYFFKNNKYSDCFLYAKTK